MPNLLRLSRLLLPACIFFVILIFLWQGLQQDPHKLSSALIGKPVPSFTLSPLDSPEQHLTPPIFVGHVSLLNVWATWCEACRIEHPVLMDIAEVPNLKLYGLNYKDQRQNAQQWLQQYGNPYQAVIYDPQGQFGLDLGVYGTPETFLIDQHGIIRYKYIGPLDATAWKTELLPQVQKLLAQR